MSDLLRTTSSLLAAGGLLGIWGSVWPILLMLFGFSMIVFVHELGHFAVAKWAGVRVERFAIGFGRELFGFTRGETRYSFNLLPLGGYVKMLGQEDFDDKSNELKFNDDPRAFVNKPIRHRMAIVSAGVIMNILLAFVLFIIVFMAGKTGEATKLGLVVPDDPGDKAGFVPGDDIKAVNGKKIREFSEVRMAVLLAPPFEPVDFLVERADGTEETIHVVPKTSDDMDRLMVGILPGFSREILGLGRGFDPKREDHPRVGDVLVEIDGQPVTDENVNEMYAKLAHTKGDVVVERPDPGNPDAPPRRVRVEVPREFGIQPADRSDPDSVSLLGLTPMVEVASVDPKGRAALAGLEAGDVVLNFDDVPYPTQGQVYRAARDHPDEDIYFEVLKADGRRNRGFVRPKVNKKGAPTIMAHVRAIEEAEDAEDGPRARVEEVRHGGVADRAGVAVGDVILAAMDVEHPSAAVVARQIQVSKGKPIRWRVRKADGREQVVVMTPKPSGLIGAAFGVADESMIVGGIEEFVGGRRSPAAIAGIDAGSEILAVDDAPVASWRALVDELRERAGGAVTLKYRDRHGAEQVADFPVPHSLRTLIGAGPQARIVSIGGQTEVVTETSRSREPVSVNNHMGTRAALAALVGEADVEVKYRENLLSPLQTARIDVTEEMLDPWLGRIQLSHGVYLGTKTTVVRAENVLDAIGIGIQKTYYFVVQVYETINRMLFSRTVSVEHMSGPLGIVAIGGQVAKSGWVDFLFFMAIISANLAVINFLPLPIVDGGLMVFLIIEKIKGSPLSLKVQVATQMIGLFLILFAFIFVTFNDAMKLLG